MGYKMSVRLCSVSVDLDEIDCYLKIHGLTSGARSHAVYDRALERISVFATNLNLPLTLFVVGRDLLRESNVVGLRRMLSQGHEVGNHSLDHLYDLTRRDAREQEHQVVAANMRIKALLGVQPTGFRAPGYTVTDGLMRVVRDCGLEYDSSVFPCPPYYAAKAAVRLRMKLQRRNSGSVMDHPRVLLAPTAPYRMGGHYWLAGAGLLELPIQVAGTLRLPFIGTSLTLLGRPGARLLARSLVGLDFVNLELHGLDFLESSEVPETLSSTQRDLRVPLARKLESLTAAVQTLRAHRYSMLRLDEAAKAFS